MEQEHLAKLLYGESASGKADVDLDSESVEPREPRSDEEIAKLIYPEKDETYVSHDEGGRVMTLIRGLDGSKLHEANYGKDRRALVGANSSHLANADLRENVRLGDLSLERGNLKGASIAGQDAQGFQVQNGNVQGLDCRGTDLKGGSFAFSDIRGLKVDSKTDISGVQFEGSVLDVETFSRLKKCKGFATAKNLKPREPVE